MKENVVFFSMEYRYSMYHFFIGVNFVSIIFGGPPDPGASKMPLNIQEIMKSIVEITGLSPDAWVRFRNPVVWSPVEGGW